MSDTDVVLLGAILSVATVILILWGADWLIDRIRREDEE